MCVFIYRIYIVCVCTYIYARKKIYCNFITTVYFTDMNTLWVKDYPPKNHEVQKNFLQLVSNTNSNPVLKHQS